MYPKQLSVNLQIHIPVTDLISLSTEWCIPSLLSPQVSYNIKIISKPTRGCYDSYSSGIYQLNVNLKLSLKIEIRQLEWDFY